MSEYTPTTDEVRAAYFVRKTGLVVSAMSHYPEFDDWLAEVERAVAEKAWDEAARIDADCHDCIAMGGHENPYRTGGAE